MVGITTDGIRLYYSGFPTVEYWGVFDTLYNDDAGTVGSSYFGVAGAYLHSILLDGGDPEVVYTRDSNFGPMQMLTTQGAVLAVDPNGGGGTESQIYGFPIDGGVPFLIYDQNNLPRNGSGLAFDPSSGLLYVADSFDGSVYSLDPTVPGSDFLTVTPSAYVGASDYSNQHYVTIAIAGGLVFLADSGKVGASSPGIYSHVLNDPAAAWMPVVIGPPLKDVEGIVYDPDDGNLYFTDSGQFIYSIPAAGGSLSSPLTNSSFIALRGITYFSGTLYAVDGQNLNNSTSQPGAVWSIPIPAALACTGFLGDGGFGVSGIPGLQLWLDANNGPIVDGGNVLAWTDLSGTATTPFVSSVEQPCTLLPNAQNGLPVVSCADAGEGLIFPPTTNMTSASVFVVYRNTVSNPDYAVDYYQPFCFGATIDAPGDYLVVSLGTDPSHASDLLTEDNIEITAGFGDATVATCAGVAASGPAAPFQLLDWTTSSAQNTAVFSNGGSCQTSLAGTDEAWHFQLGSGSPDDISGLGLSPQVTTTYNAQDPDPQFGEILFFNRVLFPCERQEVEGYLAWKWGLESSLPAGHPYQGGPP